MLRRRRSPGAPRSAPSFSWRALAFEVFAVVLGVTLALGANELRQRFADERRVEVATASMVAEMEQNCQRLGRALTYHQLVTAEMDSLGIAGADVFDRDAMRAIPSWRGFNPAFITTSAYETARATGALELMPYDLALGLGNYYTFADFYRETVRAGLGAVMQAGTPTYDQISVVLGVTLELERKLESESCKGAARLGGGGSESDEPTESASDTTATAS